MLREGRPNGIVYWVSDCAGSAKRYNREWEKRTGNPVHWIEGAGHNSNADRPAEVNALIEQFVEGL
ncbi:hypothetical protein PZH32_02260 [Adlercreutzia equolifaciens]|uniref:alpha/beta fold hydrolase n=1 Tax=Adlercreutzia equolifaciens TaxID=446660 RepID=UPI0023AFE18C|nr:hypothetical protein [Adlercreutzia equolifaciens]MDE8701782.1 hypothetical protein [Adlercreutzia equolifaciens]